MAEPTIQLGGGNWAGKKDNLLGYYQEDGRFYKQDFTFSRSTTGTYTDKDGYIQEMPYNLLQQSNDFDTTWTKTLTTISSNEIDAPIGNEMADGVVATATSGGHRVLQAPSTSSVGTFTMFIKQKELSRICVHFLGANKAAGFDCSDNTTFSAVGIAAFPTRYTISDFANGWSKVEMYDVGVTTRIDIYIANPTDGGNNAVWTGDGFSKIYFSSAQFVKGSTAKTYFPTTTRLNMPRVDYLNNSNGSLILEPQRSNLNTYSSDYTVTTALTRITVSSDYGTSPSGLSDSTAIFNTATNGRHNIGGLYFSVTSGTTYVNSVFAKAGTLSKINLRMFSGGGTSIGFNDGTFDLINGTATGTGASIEDYGNGWYRCIVVDSPTSSVSNARYNIELLDNNGSVSYLGSTDEYVEIYGSQVEAGSYPTTLINTSGSSVTRNADACTDGGDASRFNSSEGVLYAEIAALADDGTNRIISLSEDGNTGNRVNIFYTSGSNKMKFTVRVNDSNEFNETVTLSNILDYNKVALKFAENNFAVYINGVKEEEQLSGSTYSANTLDKLNFDQGGGNYDFYGKCKQIQVYNTALTDSELITLTTL